MAHIKYLVPDGVQALCGLARLDAELSHAAGS